MMETNVKQQPEVQTALTRIESLLKELPAESLVVVYQFVRFVNEQARQGQLVVTGATGSQSTPPYKYPTVPVPASIFANLIGIMPPVGGDALADTEALYDDL
jgi:hypothetical protein